MTTITHESMCKHKITQYVLMVPHNTLVNITHEYINSQSVLYKPTVVYDPLQAHVDAWNVSMGDLA